MEYLPPDSDEKNGKSKAKDTQDEANNKPWGEGQKLGKGVWKPSGITGAGGASVPVPPNRTSKANPVVRARSPTPDWGVEDEDGDYFDYDSDN